MKMAPYYCCVSGCRNNTGDDNVSLFRFPEDPSRCTLWLRNSGRTDLLKKSCKELHANYRMCEIHFTNEMFSGPKKNRLKKFATPTIFNFAHQNPAMNVQKIVVDIEEKENCPPLEDTVMEQPSLQNLGPSQISPIYPEDTVMEQPPLWTLDPSHISPIYPETTNISDENMLIEDSYQQQPSSSTSDVLNEPKKGSTSTISLDYTFQQPSTSRCTVATNCIDVSVQTPTSLSAGTPRKKKLEAKIKSLKRKLDILTSRAANQEKPTMASFLEFCKEHCSEELATFLQMSLKGSKKGKKVPRYSNELKQFALTIYFLSPQVFRVIRKTFSLPSKSTLYRITRKWNIQPGLNDFIFDVIKSKVSTLQPNAKDCVLCIDEMSLKKFLFYNRGSDDIIGFHHTLHKKSYEPAKSVLVLMARGIVSNWKQPVSYFFVNVCSKEDLQTIIFECIRKLSSTGLNILGLISDQGSNFVNFTMNLKISPEKPYFMVDHLKVFFLFDVPHLLKSVRNNFFKYIFHLPEGATDKTFLDIFYEKDKQLRLVPKLTNEHLNPNSFQKMKVKLAAQVFSATVAAALNTYIALGSLPSTAYATVLFIQKMDKLFDLFNSHKVGGSKEYNRPFVGAEYQMNYLEEMLSLFNNLRVTDRTGNDVTNALKFIKGWKITIKSFLELWQILRDKQVTSIYTRRLNQDCLENFFGNIRQQGGNCLNPTPIQCHRAFKKLFCLNYFHHFEGANCIDDMDSVLTSLNPESITHYNILIPEQTLFSNLKIGTTDYINLDFAQKNALTYISGYIMNKCLSKHECTICRSYAKETENLSQEYLFCYFKAYENKEKDTFGNLMTPPENFVQYICHLENVFCSIFPTLAVQSHVGIKIKEKCKNIIVPHPCDEFPKDFLISLYVRLRIFYSLKFLNRDIKGSKGNRKLKNLQHL